MKKRYLVTALTIVAMLVCAAAFAITTYTAKPGDMPYSDGTILQNAGGIAPKQGATVCVATTIHHAGDIATFRLYTSNRWYQQASWTAVNSATGAAYVVQRKVGNSTTGKPGSSGDITVNREYGTYTLSTFGNNTSASLTLCQDRQ